MLDEKIEVIEYLCNPDIAEPRISANILFENYKAECKLDRVQDILTLIASHYLYDFCKGDIIDEETKKSILEKYFVCASDFQIAFTEIGIKLGAKLLIDLLDPYGN